MPGPGLLDRVRDAVGRFLGRLRKLTPVERREAEAVALRAEHARAVEALTRRMVRGELAIPDWQAAMRDELRRLHLGQAMAARGGREFMTAQDWGQVGGRLRGQYRYLDRFAETLRLRRDGVLAGMTKADGTPLAFHPEDALAVRARLYAGAGKATYYMALMPPLPQYPGDGNTACMTNCKCYLDVRQPEPAVWHVFWKLTPAEHCEDCLRLTDEWRPLIVTG